MNLWWQQQHILLHDAKRNNLFAVIIHMNAFTISSISFKLLMTIFCLLWYTDFLLR